MMPLFDFTCSSLQGLQEILDKDLHPDLLEELKKNPKEAIRSITKVPTEDDFKQYGTKTVQQFREVALHDERLLELIRHDPKRFLTRMLKEPLPPQFQMYKLLFGCLCATLIIIVVGVMVAWFVKKRTTPPQFMIVVACTILGMLAGMFISIPGKAQQREVG
jgi:hypothetical protein